MALTMVAASSLSDYIQWNLIGVCALGAGCGMLVCFFLEKLFRSKKAENLRAFMVGTGSAFAILILYEHDPVVTGIAVALGSALGVFAVAALLKLIHWLSKGKDD